MTSTFDFKSLFDRPFYCKCELLYDKKNNFERIIEIVSLKDFFRYDQIFSKHSLGPHFSKTIFYM